MPTMNIRLDGDNAWTDLDRKEMIHYQETIQVVALESGMSSGKPSIAFRFDLPDGRVLIAETSARLFVMAAAAVVGRWPDVDDGTMLAHIEKGKSATIQIFSENKKDNQ